MAPNHDCEELGFDLSDRGLSWSIRPLLTNGPILVAKAETLCPQGIRYQVFVLIGMEGVWKAKAETLIFH